MSGTSLVYFGGNGRADGIKLALHLANIPFTFTPVADWPAFKAEGIKSGLLPFGQVPLIHIDGMDIVQSITILRYISKKYLSKNVDDKTGVFIDMMTDGWNDLLNKYYSAKYSVKNGLEPFMKGECLNQLDMLEKEYKRIGKKFMAGDSVSIADAHAYGTVCQMKIANPSLLSAYPSLSAWESLMNELEGTKKYLAEN